MTDNDPPLSGDRGLDIGDRHLDLDGLLAAFSGAGRRQARPLERYTVQREWGWKVAGYLFLGGVAGGAVAGGYLVSLLTGGAVVLQLGLGVGLVCIGLGMALLVADLGVRYRALYVFRRVRRSWMARGAWIITAFAGLSFAQFVGLALGWAPASSPVLGGTNGALGVLVMAYTGVLLKQSRAISSWNTPALVALFAVSAASTGVMSLLLVTPAYGALVGLAEEGTLLVALSRLDVALLLLEGLVLLVYLGAIGRTPAGATSRRLWTRGPLAREFWGLFVVGGLVVPLAAEGLHLWAGLGTSPLAVAMATGLLGGLVLRGLVLRAGVNEPHRLGDVELPQPGATDL